MLDYPPNYTNEKKMHKRVEESEDREIPRGSATVRIGSLGRNEMEEDDLHRRRVYWLASYGLNFGLFEY